MHKQEKGFSRRQLLQMAIGVGGVALTGLANLAFAQEARRVFTPPLTLGPFYPMVKPLDQDADLTAVLAGKRTRAQGKVIHLMGRVLNLKGEPVSGAKVEIWQADTHGRYSHLSDPNPAPLDPNFQGYGVQTTDAQGRYRFKTIKPGGYPGFVPGIGMRTPHIHFDVSGKIDRLVTQMFFPDEPLNEQDVILQSLKGPGKEAVFAKPMPSTKEIEAGAMSLVWDIVLLKG
jgi:protocatechuate 3,4-dioxygenase beta subunit